MTLDQVHYFLVLSQALTFTRAAKLCGISQPSMTNAIGALEAELGVPLFHRSRQVRLSEWGERIKPVFERIETAAREARSLTGTKKSAARRRPRPSSKLRRRRKHPAGGRSSIEKPEQGGEQSANGRGLFIEPNNRNPNRASNRPLS
jgi:DNA-binding transcriptional LysR family regulator